MQTNVCRLKGNNYFSQSTDCAPVNKAQDALGLNCCQHTLQAPAELVVVPELPQSYSPCQSVPRQGFFLPRGRTLHLSLLNFIFALNIASSGIDSYAHTEKVSDEL